MYHSKTWDADAAKAYTYNWLYPLGFLGLGFCETLFTQWIVYFHAPPGSTTPGQAWIGTILLINFLLQGLFNPLLGFWADRIRHPWGRRRPFIILGSLPLAVVFYGIWLWKAWGISFLMICLFGLLFVCVVQSYVALLPSVARDQATRVRYSLIGGVLNLTASGLALIGGPLLLERTSFHVFGLLGCAGILLTVFLPSLLLREVLPAAAELSPQTSFLAQMRDVLKNRTFVCFLLGNGSVILMIVSLTIALPFLCETLLELSLAYTSTINICVFVGVVLAILYNALHGSRLSYLHLLRNLALINAGVLCVFGLVSRTISLPLPLWWLGFVSLGFMVLVAMMSPNIILAAFTDADGQNREGAIFGLNGLAICFANAFASQITASLLTLGKKAGQADGVHAVLIFAMGTALLAAWALHQTIRRQQGDS